MWKIFRLILLVCILVKAVQQSYADSIDLGWQKKFYVAVYPINAEPMNTPAYREVNAHIKLLTNDDFQEVTTFFAKQAAQYGLGISRPIEMMLGDTLKYAPPSPPSTNNVPKVMLWSLGFRLYSWVFSPVTEVEPDIKLYLVYHNPDTNPTLGISTALKKGRIGRINVFGERTYHQQNLVVIAHELLHTLNATDKYDDSNNQPIYPDGFAEPMKEPLYPQQYAELMGGRLPVTKEHAEMPSSLNEAIIGKKTAKEIGWL